LKNRLQNWLELQLGASYLAADSAYLYRILKLPFPTYPNQRLDKILEKKKLNGI
jgi:hypothetical protein